MARSRFLGVALLWCVGCGPTARPAAVRSGLAAPAWETDAAGELKTRAEAWLGPRWGLEVAKAKVFAVPERDQTLMVQADTAALSLKADGFRLGLQRLSVIQDRGVPVYAIAASGDAEAVFRADQTRAETRFTGRMRLPLTEGGLRLPLDPAGLRGRLDLTIKGEAAADGLLLAVKMDCSDCTGNWPLSALVPCATARSLEAGLQGAIEMKTTPSTQELLAQIRLQFSGVTLTTDNTRIRLAPTLAESELLGEWQATTQNAQSVIRVSGTLGKPTFLAESCKIRDEAASLPADGD